MHGLTSIAPILIENIMGSNSEVEALRNSYRPEVIRVLFIGESPPAGGTFFYQGDSNLARYTRKAFANVWGNAVGDSDSFLNTFKGLGCYLDDLCLTPINYEAKRERRRYWENNIDDLAIRLRNASPQAIVVIMKAITPFVKRAVVRAGYAALPFEEVKFPAQGNQVKSVEELTVVLKKLQRFGILHLS